MKSYRVIRILFFFLVITSSCEILALPGDYSTSRHGKSFIDSVFVSQNAAKGDSVIAKKIIKEYETLIDNNVSLNAKDYKRLAISYANVGDAINSSGYLNSYIKSSFDINILHSELFTNVSASNSFQVLKKTYLPKFNGWILFFLFSGVVGIFISITINLRKKGDRVANMLISLFVLLHSLFILHLCLYLTNYVYVVPHSLWITITFSLLYGPLLYFYVKRVSQGYQFKVTDLYHLIPTVILIIYFIPTYLIPGSVKQFKIFNVDNHYVITLYIILLLKSMSLIIYSILVYRIYKRQEMSDTKLSSDVRLWQRNITYLNFFYALTYSVYAIVISSVVFDRSKSFMLYSQVFVLALIVMYIAFVAYVKPRVFNEKYLFNAGESNLLKKYQKSGLTESYSVELKEQLLSLFNDEKVFKENNLNLNSLSERMGTTRHNLSQVINEHFNMNFFNLINKYRIQEAQSILLNDINCNLNIIDVAYDVGFNNKVTFNKAFKEQTNLTPSQFIKKHQSPPRLGVNF